MTGRETVLRISLVIATFGSVVWAAIPVARHMAGLVVLEAPEPLEIPVRQADARPDLAAILRLAPFGRAAAPETNQPTPDGARPDIVLRGIFAARTGVSTALLDVAGVPGLYRERMTVANRLQVARITPAYVWLRDGETTITLRFDADAETTADVTDTQAEAAPALIDRLQGGFVVADAYVKPGKPQTTSEYIDYWRHRVRKNPQAVLDEIGLMPTDRGYVIADRHDPGVRLAGLRSGDLVRSVNGQPVGNPEADTRFYDQIAAAGQARIEVERDGRILSFSFPLR